MAFQLMLLEARDAVEAVLAADRAVLGRGRRADPHRAAQLRRRLPADALCRRSSTRRGAAPRRRALAARFGVSFEQACHRLSTLQRAGARGVPFFFLRVDPAGNVTKRFSAAGFPFARFGGSCPRWVVHAAFATPGRAGAGGPAAGRRHLPVLRPHRRTPGRAWGEPTPCTSIAMGCDIGHAPDLVYADGIDLERAAVGIGLSCRLCDREGCRSRAFPPLEHRLALDPHDAERQPLPLRAAHPALRRTGRTGRQEVFFF